MRLLLATAGSRGDVEPFIALARAASARGHEVVLLGPAGTAALAADARGVEVREVDADFRRMLRELSASPWAAVRGLERVVRPAMRSVLLGAARAGLEVEPDVILHHPKVLSAPLVAARVGAARAVVELVPSLTPTAAFPAPGTVRRSLGPPLNRATYRLASATAAMFRAELREAAALLGEPQPAPAAGSLVPISSAILPRPRDWPRSAHLTGAWTSPAPQAPLEPALESFLARGDVVAVGFGSMVWGDAAQRGAAFVLAARALGLRTLVLRGWGGADVPQDVLGDDVLVIDAAPHAAVLPRSLVAVHHGGAGTSHAAVRAAAPSVVVPFQGDQSFWAATLHRRGLASAPLSQRRLSARSAGAAIEAALRRRERCAEIGAIVAAEDGTGAALDLVESLR